MHPELEAVGIVLHTAQRDSLVLADRPRSDRSIRQGDGESWLSVLANVLDQTVAREPADPVQSLTGGQITLGIGVHVCPKPAYGLQGSPSLDTCFHYRLQNLHVAEMEVPVEKVVRTLP